MERNERVIVYQLHPDARVPEYAHDTDAGADVYSLDSINIPPKTLAKIPLGISVELPHGYELQVRSRSGLSAKSNVFVLNSPGTIDTDYREEISVLLYNLGDEHYYVRKGDRVAQLVLAPVYHAQYVRLIRNGGFGSTGMQALKTPSKAEVIPFELVETPAVEEIQPGVTKLPAKNPGFYVNSSDEGVGFLNATLNLAG